MKSASFQYKQHTLNLGELALLGRPHDLAKQYGLTLPSDIEQATDKRAFDYLGGRLCASLSLKALGCADVGQLLSADNRIVNWPNGYIASISHSGQRVTAVAASDLDIQGIGVDLERVMSNEKAVRLSARLLTIEEITKGVAAAGEIGLQTTLIFSAKESIFKCLYPLVHQFFGFKDATCIDINYESAKMTFKLNKHLSDRFRLETRLSVAFKLDQDFVETLCLVHR